MTGSRKADVVNWTTTPQYADHKDSLSIYVPLSKILRYFLMRFNC